MTIAIAKRDPKTNRIFRPRQRWRRIAERSLIASLGLACLMSFAAASEENKYEITAVEKTACTADAMRLCRHTYPDQDQLMGCFRSNIKNLSLVCSVAFKAGMKKRGLPL